MENLIKDQILNFMEKPNGLSIVEVPTGRGKTYTVLQCIVECRKKYPDRKIFFVTTQKKNLPMRDLEKAYEDNGYHEFKKEVIEIKPIIDTFLDSKNTGFQEAEKTCKQWEEYRKLSEILVSKKNIESSNVYSMNEYEKNNLRKDLNDAEYHFRKKLTLFLKEELKSSGLLNNEDIDNASTKEKRTIIKSYLKKIIESKYKWVKNLYPTVECDSKSVFLLSMHKFVYGNATIVEPLYKFINCELTENAIVFIDEFDSTKNVIDDIIINNTANNFIDKINLFKKIHLGFTSHFPKIYMNTCNTKRVHLTFEVMKKKTDELYNKLFKYSSLQLAKEYRNNKTNFMFHDGTIHSIGTPNKRYIVAVINDETEKLDIKFLDKKEYDAIDKDSIIHVSSILENIEDYFKTFRNFIKRWASKYSKETKVSEEDGVSSILYEFDISGAEAANLMESNLYYMPYDSDETEKQSIEDIMPDVTYYNYGFDIHYYLDSEKHNEDTEIKTLKKYDTPEKFMKNLCNHSNVIGISATALIPTYDNYSLSYLEDNIESDYSIINKDVLSQIQEKETAFAEQYKKKGVKIHTEILKGEELLGNVSKKEDRLYEALRTFLDKDEANQLSNIIKSHAGFSNNKYELERYIDIIKAMYDFWSDDNAHAWLFLSWPLLTNENKTFNINVIKKALEKIIDSTGKECDENDDIDKVIVVLSSSESFEKLKNQLSTDLAAGKKRMVFSSYATLMAGQNLNYKYNPKVLKDYVVLGKKDGKDSRYRTTDYDGIVLGDITHQNLWKQYNPENNTDSNKEKLQLCSKIQIAYESDLISKSDQEILINYAVGDEQSANSTAVVNKINNSSMFRNKVLQIVMQSIGRITRTFVKNKDIKIYISSKILGSIDKDEFKKHLLTPELQSIYDLCPGVKPNDVDTYSLRANTNSSRANRLINNLMNKEDNEWIESNMKIWENTRQDVLCNPTSDKERKYKGLYFETDTNATRYYFCQVSDFSEVRIDFRNTKEEFIRKYNLRDYVGNKSLIISEVSEEACRLQKILKCPGMKEYFEKQGYATSFEPKPFIMTPVVFQNIYKGALGEVCGKFIFEEYFHIPLKKIEDPKKYELFDYEIQEGVYVDFKHWRPYFYADRTKTIQKILKKLEACGGKKAYIVNILAEENFMPEEICDNRIVVIQNLINETDSKVNFEAMKMIIKENTEEKIRNENK